MIPVLQIRLSWKKSDNFSRLSQPGSGRKGTCPGADSGRLYGAALMGSCSEGGSRDMKGGLSYGFVYLCLGDRFF